jgi:hypothetical protein
VSEPEFLFALELSDEASFDRMLADIADAVFLYLGFTRQAVEALAADIRGALAGPAGAARRPCAVRFVVRGRDMEIVVAHEGAAEWRTRQSLP